MSTVHHADFCRLQDLLVETGWEIEAVREMDTHWVHPEHGWLLVDTPEDDVHERVPCHFERRPSRELLDELEFPAEGN